MTERKWIPGVGGEHPVPDKTDAKTILTPADLDAIREQLTEQLNELREHLDWMESVQKASLAKMQEQKDHADQRQARIDTLEEALYPLVHKDTPRDGVDYAYNDNLRCRHCRETLYWTGVNEHGENVYAGHTDDCAWVVGRDVLGSE